MKSKKIIRFTVLSLILIIFLYLAFRDINFSRLFGELSKTNYILAAGGMLVGVLAGSIVRALRWRYLLNPLKKDISMGNLFSAVMIGYLMNALIPRAGEVARPVLLAQKEGISRGSAFGTILVERVFDMLSMFLAFGFCLFFFRERISNAFYPYNIELISLLSSIAILLFVVVFVILLFNIEKTELFIEKITSKILPQKAQERIKYIFVSIINGFLFIKDPSGYLKIFLTTVILWLLYVLSTFLSMLAFSMDLSFLDANLVLSMISFAQTIPLPGNSAGSFYLFVKTVLVSVYNIEPETAIGFAIVNHLLGVIGILIIGFYYSIKENYKFNIDLKEDKQS